jgi:hypothetical protein
MRELCSFGHGLDVYFMYDLVSARSSTRGNEMAKNMLPMKPRSGPVGKIIGAIVTVALLVLIVRYPADIAGWVTGTAHLLIRIVNGLVTFARQIGGH